MCQHHCTPTFDGVTTTDLGERAVSVKGVSVLLDTKCVDDRIHELAVQIAAEETVPPVILGIPMAPPHS